MTTKDNLLFSTRKQQTFVNSNNDQINKDNKYSNLNLNQNNKCLNEISGNSFQSKSNKAQNFVTSTIIDHKINDNYQRQEASLKTRRKSSNDGFCSNPWNQTKEEKDKKECKTNENPKNGSTLSLHIAAYENSMEDSNSNSNISATATNLFKFPRQQQQRICEPEMMQFKASQNLYDPNERQHPHSSQRKEQKKVSFAAAVQTYEPRSKSVGTVLNLKAARARQAFIRHNPDREHGGRVKLAEGHIIEAKNIGALQFFSTHHDYRRGKIRENYIPQFPSGAELYKNATLKPGSAFLKAMYDDVLGITCVNAAGEPVTIKMIGSFAEAGICEKLLSNVTKMGITNPLPIQCFLIPYLLNYDRDIVASAATGSGKTIAVMLPLIELCIRQKKKERLGCNRPPHAPYVIVIGATRDLVHQFCLDSMRLANDTGIQIKSAYGEYQRDANAQHIREGCDILISTTGRFVDLVDKEDVLVQHARYFAVDEADKLVTDELFQDLHLVLKDRIRTDIVHALFSATFNHAVLDVLPKLLRNNFIRVELQTEKLSPTVKQRFYDIQTFERKTYVKKILKKVATVIPPNELPYDTTNFTHPVQYRVPKTIIYGESRRTIDYLAIYLSMSGIRSISMHGGRSQTQRNDAWSGFISGKYQVLCASNVAARGINFPDVELIINYDPPIDMDTYVHRIGRAGRLGFNAKAITFLDPTDTQQMMLASNIVPALQKLGQPIPAFLRAMANFIQYGTQDDINCYL